MAKKKKPAIPSLRNQIRQTIKELDGIEKDLAAVQATLERYLKRPQRLLGEDEYFADLRALTRRKR
jgi:hypothetical protein